MKKFEIKNYTETELRKELASVKITDTGVRILTTYKGETLSNVGYLTKKYGIFNFGEFVNELITPLKEYFTPKYYKLIITGGLQEIRLFGDKVMVNGNEYTRTLSIVSSSNGKIRLQMNAGLSTPGGRYFYVGTDENVGVSCKHFKNSVKNRVTEFTEALPFLGVMFESQEKLIEALGAENVSLKEFGNALVLDKKGNVKKSDAAYFNALFKVVVARLKETGNKQITEAIVPADTKKPITGKKFLETEGLDLNVNSYDILDMFAGLYSDRDGSTMKLGIRKCFDILNGLKINNVTA